MSVPNPCCCFSTRFCTFIIGILNLFLSIIGTIVFSLEIHPAILALVDLKQSSTNESTSSIKRRKILFLTFIIIYVILFVHYFFVNIILIRGSVKKQINNCRRWIVGSTTILILFVILRLLHAFILHFNYYWNTSTNAAVLLVQLIVLILVHTFQLWVVNAFIYRIKHW